MEGQTPWKILTDRKIPLFWQTPNPDASGQDRGKIGLLLSATVPADFLLNMATQRWPRSHTSSRLPRCFSKGGKRRPKAWEATALLGSMDPLCARHWWKRGEGGNTADKNHFHLLFRFYPSFRKDQGNGKKYCAWCIQVVYLAFERLWKSAREAFAPLWSLSKLSILKNLLMKSSQKIWPENSQKRRPCGSLIEHGGIWPAKFGQMCRPQIFQVCLLHLSEL